MQPYEKVTMNKRHIIINNFIGGISWGLGATLGLAIVLTVLGFILSKMNWIPVVGDFVTKVSVYVSQKSLNLLQ